MGHLRQLASKQPVIGLTPRSMEADHGFIISIDQFVNDIEKSIKDPDKWYLFIDSRTFY
jgi:hypothetical protein